MAHNEVSVGFALCVGIFVLAVIAAIIVPIVLIFSAPSQSHSKHFVGLPSHSVRSDSDPDLFFIEEEGGMVEGILRIRREVTGNGTGGHISDSCCGYIVPMAKLKEGMHYDLDVLAFGLGSSFVDSTWMEALKLVNNAIGKNLFGERRHAEFLGLSLNGRNQIGAGHADFGGGDVLAATLIWVRCSIRTIPIASCPLETREIFEWKQFYNVDIHPFGDARVNGVSVFDLMAIFVHETLHCTNADDLRKIGCEDSTMWFSTARGETKKRSIDTATVKCMRNLYFPSTGSPRPPVSGGECERVLWWE